MSEKSSGMNPRFNLAEALRQDGIEGTRVKVTHGEKNKSVEVADKIEHEINYDDLTGLLNRKGWGKKLEASLAEGGEKAVIFIDVTNLKRINDEAPDLHEAGHRVLRQVAGVLKKSLRQDDGDTLMHGRSYRPDADAGRIGGDEFGILLDLSAREDVWTQKDPTERMNVVVHRLRDKFDKMKRENPTLSNYGFDVAIGGAVWEPGMEPTALLTAADEAMKQDKASQHQELGKYR